jgi:hypothetical protein
MRVKNPVSASFCLVGTFRKRYERNHYLKRQRCTCLLSDKSLAIVAYLLGYCERELWTTRCNMLSRRVHTIQSNFVESDRLDRMNTPKMTLVATDREFKESDSNRTCSIASNTIMQFRQNWVVWTALYIYDLYWAELENIYMHVHMIMLWIAEDSDATMWVQNMGMSKKPLK